MMSTDEYESDSGDDDLSASAVGVAGAEAAAAAGAGAGHAGAGAGHAGAGAGHAGAGAGPAGAGAPGAVVRKNKRLRRQGGGQAASELWKLLKKNPAYTGEGFEVACARQKCDWGNKKNFSGQQMWVRVSSISRARESHFCNGTCTGFTRAEIGAALDADARKKIGNRQKKTRLAAGGGGGGGGGTGVGGAGNCTKLQTQTTLKLSVPPAFGVPFEIAVTRAVTMWLAATYQPTRAVDDAHFRFMLDVVSGHKVVTVRDGNPAGQIVLPGREVFRRNLIPELADLLGDRGLSDVAGCGLVRDCCHGFNLVIRRAVGRRLAPLGRNDEDDGADARDSTLRKPAAGAGGAPAGPVVMGIIPRGSDAAAVVRGQQRLPVGDVAAAVGAVPAVAAAAAAAAAGGGGGGGGGGGSPAAAAAAGAAAAADEAPLGRGHRNKFLVRHYAERDAVPPAPRDAHAEDAVAGPAVAEGEFTPAELEDHLSCLIEFLAVTSDEVLEHAQYPRIL